MRELSSRGLGWLLTVCGAIGLAAAGILSVEKYRLSTNPFYVPSCSINESVSCTTIMNSEQSAAFGFPNPYLGLVGFAVILTIGVAVLAGARFARWFWVGLGVGILAGLAFVLWLMFQSIVVIGAYCPYCMIVWVVMFALTAGAARALVRARGSAAP